MVFACLLDAAEYAIRCWVTPIWMSCHGRRAKDERKAGKNAHELCPSVRNMVVQKKYAFGVRDLRRLAATLGPVPKTWQEPVEEGVVRGVTCGRARGWEGGASPPGAEESHITRPGAADSEPGNLTCDPGEQVNCGTGCPHRSGTPALTKECSSMR